MLCFPSFPLPRVERGRMQYFVRLSPTISYLSVQPAIFMPDILLGGVVFDLKQPTLGPQPGMCSVHLQLNSWLTSIKSK